MADEAFDMAIIGGGTIGGCLAIEEIAASVKIQLLAFGQHHVPNGRS